MLVRSGYAGVLVLSLLFLVAEPRALQLPDLEQQLRQLSMTGLSGSTNLLNNFPQRSGATVPGFTPFSLNMAQQPAYVVQPAPAFNFNSLLETAIGATAKNKAAHKRRHHHHHHHHHHNNNNNNNNNNMLNQLLLLQQAQQTQQINPQLLALQQQIRDMNRQPASVVAPDISGGGTPCQRKAVRERRRCGNKIACYVTQCSIDGEFSSRQCDPTNGFCWCADQRGSEIDRTRVFQHKTSLHESSCNKLRASQAAPLSAGNVALVEEPPEQKISSNIQTIEEQADHSDEDNQLKVKPDSASLVANLHSCDSFCQSHCSTSIALQPCLDKCGKECDNRLK